MNLVIATNFLPSRFDAYTVGFVILVRPEKRNNKALIAHEATHVKQFWRTFGLAGLFYTFSKKKRYEYELEAYRAQLALSQGSDGVFATYLATNYGLDVTVAEARADLLKQG
ncbi:MAG: hypothetical protein CGW95_14985 [Phenylobacterium zucineum]|nr:MAG: hypothetical protein CGW95_14985 [Phenylobacterium zucineum]